MFTRQLLSTSFAITMFRGIDDSAPIAPPAPPFSLSARDVTGGPQESRGEGQPPGSPRADVPAGYRGEVYMPRDSGRLVARGYCYQTLLWVPNEFRQDVKQHWWRERFTAVLWSDVCLVSIYLPPVGSGPDGGNEELSSEHVCLMRWSSGYPSGSR